MTQTILTQPVHSHVLHQSQDGARLVVSLWGKCPRVNTTDGLRFAINRAKQQAKRAAGCNNLLLVLTPEPQDQPPYRVLGLGLESILYHESQAVSGDAIMAPGDAHWQIGLQHRDCPCVVLFNRRSREVGLVHAGRDQLRNHSNHPNLLSLVIKYMARQYADRQNLAVWVGGGISGQYFTHEKNPACVEDFRHEYGPDVFHGDLAHRALCLDRVIATILKQEGVPEENITFDELCTFSNPELGSKRAEDAGIEHKWRPNLTLVVRA